MWTIAETMVTTSSMTALSVSRRSAQCTCSSPASIQVKRSTTPPRPPSATSEKMTMLSTAEMQSAPHVTSWAPRSPTARPPSPATTARVCTRSALHQVDVFDGDGAAVAEIDDEDGEADRRLGRRDGEHEHG